MTRYTQLRHSGYYTSGLTDAERQAIADKVDNGDTPNETPKGSTTSHDLAQPAAKTSKTSTKKSA